MREQRSLPEKVKLFCGIITGKESLALSACEKMEALFGPIDLRSEFIPFDSTDYYAAEMGPGLWRQFVAFRDPVDPGNLADIKIRTNALELEFARESGMPARRTVNLDPGLLTAAKVVLATTKDFAHRIYLKDGIYAEITFNFRKSGLVFFDWTYPDFKSGKYDSFFLELRRRYMASAPGKC